MAGVEWRDGDIVVVDQTKLPHRREYLTLSTTDEIVEAIAFLRVRGAPALGIIAAYGTAQAALRTISSSARTVFEAAERAGRAIVETRPTAVNMAWAVERMLAAARPLVSTGGSARLRKVLVDEALAIHAEDEQACEAMAAHASVFFRPQGVVMTHCNTGALVTGGIGTALGAIRRAFENGVDLAVIATETRPLLQGARLTAWELGRLGIPHAVVVDAAAPGLIARGEVSMVMVGADRIAANGDTANKVGTYPLALAAANAGVPFIVVAPTSTLDMATPSGEKIEVEERSAYEVTTILGALESAPSGTEALNPAFDVTPGDLISAIITERGVAEQPFDESLAAMMRGSRAAPRKATVKKKSGKKKAPARKAPAKKKAAVKQPAKRSAKSSGKTPPKKKKNPARSKR